MLIKVTISGVTPLLMNRFSEQTEVKLSSGISSSIKANGSGPRETAEHKLYADNDGFLYIPGTMLFSSIIAAGIYHKVGKSKLTTQKSSLIPAGISIEELVCPLNTKDWEVDSRSVVIPSTGGRIMTHRPRLDEWTTTFHINFDPNMFSEKLVRLLVDDAGSKCGIGDFRPNRKGPFGKFVVSGWTVEK
jgi:hypothetical protein